MIALAEPWIEGFGWLVSDRAAVFFAKWEDGSILDEVPPPTVKRVFAILQTETLFPAKKNFMLGALLYCYPSLLKENSSLFGTAEGKENRTSTINSVARHVTKEWRQANVQTNNVKEKKGKEKEKKNEKEEDKEENKEDLKDAAAGDTELSDVELLQAELQLLCLVEILAGEYVYTKQLFEELMCLSLREEGAAVWQRGNKREGDGGKEEKEEEEDEDDDEDDEEEDEEEKEDKEKEEKEKEEKDKEEKDKEEDEEDEEEEEKEGEEEEEEEGEEG
ncbi:uncharacterized protein MONOS_13886 [Monocercomonoides exilis]|uniref:uncharacterized protein n=1 Tax=Monocercomonoides exilis TaxID=2049356 RepID=UPI00355ACAC0|nr:hypothetical protein MONOS_13886 [Monocercomonoides exilis]|eukprot:MONOS_13886.1-p1 / transcript=MONOS_13886.1 / gene=MONOS_13886 / organism=Monocercomonoides_exilis_PA203 / gene_product=unspecified product / transcript_product=unspecified product / location=Mono_scaffold00899:2092-2960(+) / protein_length=276 / sequence_SO=supercontig / SO=protein_coding / is_pseudo=false